MTTPLITSGIDRVRDTLVENTERFARGHHPAGDRPIRRGVGVALLAYQQNPILATKQSRHDKGMPQRRSWLVPFGLLHVAYSLRPLRLCGRSFEE